MMSLQQILDNPMVERIGFALMHSLWQCTAIAVLLAVVLVALRKRRSQVRYNVAVSALLLMVIATAATVFVAGGAEKVAPAPAPEGPVAQAPAGVITTGEMPVVVADAAPAAVEAVPVPVVIVIDEPAVNAAGIAEKIEIVGPYLAIAWIVGVLILSVWHLGGWAQLRRLRRVMVKSVEDHIADKLDRLARSLAVTRTIEIVESALVTVPTVIGAFKPVILLPASALTGLSAEQLEMILAHELAHIKRNDYLMNLIQTAIDILLFYHPAAWYVSRKIRDERENCCDDIAVRVTGDSLKYARALATMEEIKSTNRRLAVAATGGNFFDRIARLVGKEETRKTKPAWQTVVITMLVVFAAVLPLCFAMNTKADGLSAKKLVEDFFKHNYRDITARKTIEWGEQTKDEDGNVSIRYKYQATIWGKDKVVNDAVFTFDKNGKYVSAQKLKDTKTKEGLQTLVTGFFATNFRDISARKTIEWGQPVQHENGNASIRYKYEATIRGKVKVTDNKLFTFDKNGKFLVVEDVKGKDIPTQPKFTAILGNGVKLELIGICEHPSTGKQWWGPDGTALETRPYDKCPHTTGGGAQKHFEYVCRLSGGDELQLKSKHAGSGVQCLAEKQTQIHLPKPETLYYGIFRNDGRSKQTDITLLVGSESGWKTTSSMDSPSEVKSSRLNNVIMMPPIEKNGVTYIDVVDLKVDGQFRVIAIDKDGKMHDGTGNHGVGKNVASIRAHFDLPIKNIKSIEYQTQKFVPVTFKNVSLKAGHKTDVSVTGNRQVSSPLDMKIDFSSITRETTIEEAFELIRKKTKSSLSIVVLWNALSDNFIERDSPVGVDGIGKTSLQNGLDIILRSISNRQTIVEYTYQDGVVVISVKEKETATSGGNKKIVSMISDSDESCEKQLNTQIDFSFINSYTTFGDVINRLRGRKIPGLTIAVLWNELAENFIERDALVGIDGLGRTTLRAGLGLILKSVGGSVMTDLAYSCKDGVIVINVIETKEFDHYDIGHFVTPAPSISQVRHYVRLIGVEDGFMFEGKRYKELSELDEPLSNLTDKSGTVLEWAFEPGKMPKEMKSMAWLGIIYFINDLEKQVDKHGLAGMCFAGELPVDSKRVTFPAGNSRSFAMDEEIKLDLKSDPIELTSIKFTKDTKRKGSPYKALINANVTSWPKTKLEIRLELKARGSADQNAVFYKTFENSGVIKGLPNESSQMIEVPFFGVIDDDFLEDVKFVEVRVREITTPSKPKSLQELIDAAKPNSTVIVPKGVYTKPIKITKPLTLKAQTKGECVFEITANEPALFIDTASKGEVIVEGLTIKWKLASGDRIEYASAVAVKDCKATIKDCEFSPLGNFRQSPTAARAYGFSKMYLDNCRFDGFDYTVCFSEATEGAMTNCMITKCKSQGIILYSGASVDVIGNYIANSGKHAVRSTGGKLNMLNNLIVNNANRGVYLGNKTGSGRIANNVMIGNSVGISGFASANVKIENNVILDSKFAAIAMRGSCRLKIKDNIIQDNPTGVVVYSDHGENNNTLLRNTFYNNKENTKDIKAPANTITADPMFKDAKNGDFSLKPGAALENKQGLTNPKVINALWNKNLKTPAPAKVAAQPVRDGFSAAKEFVVHTDAALETIIDFDTGKTVVMPDELRAKKDMKELMAWVTKTGVDASVKVKGSRCYIGLTDSFAVQVDNKMWLLSTPLRISNSSSLTQGTLNYGNITKKLEDLPRTYLFKTRQGAKGIFQVSSFKGTPAGVKITFRLIERS